MKHTSRSDSSSDPAVNRLMAMGFPEDRVRQQLKAANNNVQMAAELLIAAESQGTSDNAAATQSRQGRPNAWGASVATLKSIGPQYVYDKTRTDKTFVTQHIPTLSQANEARAILDRIKAEFQPIIQRRGYNISSVTEMCCCDDGLDHLPTHPRKGRKTKTMPDNVLGYNLSPVYRNASSTHRIHLRLRHAPSAGSWEHHILFPYEDVAGTMCHELAHCVHNNHDASFYKLMDEIMQEYELLMVRGVGYTSSSATTTRIDGKDPQYWSSIGGPGYTLGGATKNYNNITPTSKRNVLAQAAANRCNAKLPVAVDMDHYSDAPIHTFMTPREAAAIAAESRWLERKRIDSQFCLPCQEIIEILDDDDDTLHYYSGGNDTDTGPDIIEILD
jgi:hypothetical protein